MLLGQYLPAFEVFFLAPETVLFWVEDSRCMLCYGQLLIIEGMLITSNTIKQVLQETLVAGRSARCGDLALAHAKQIHYLLTGFHQYQREG
jgi:hypothetical protein